MYVVAKERTEDERRGEEGIMYSGNERIIGKAGRKESASGAACDTPEHKSGTKRGDDDDDGAKEGEEGAQKSWPQNNCQRRDKIAPSDADGRKAKTAHA